MAENKMPLNDPGLIKLRINQDSRGAQLLSGRALDSRQRGHRFQPHRGHYVVSLSKNINPRLVLVQPRKTHPFIIERLLMGSKESNQANKINRIPGFRTFAFIIYEIVFIIDVI